MRALVSTALTEAHQEMDLAVLLMPEAAFLVLGFLVSSESCFDSQYLRGGRWRTEFETTVGL